MSRDNEKQAFPRRKGARQVRDASGYSVQQIADDDGMTLRDYFAAKAMQGIISAMYSAQYNYTGADKVAEDAYAFADAMLKEREK